MTKIEICVYISHKREEKRGYLTKRSGGYSKPFCQVTFADEVSPAYRGKPCYHADKAYLEKGDYFIGETGVILCS
ncbi:hypothetical protein [Bacteroides sp.]|uniref:hypothetical protein n=1 Tax=Bacteroides sp. TaxID=29523 RepID=UPI002626E6CB|nr:hypothetical protein [Bacteroides sp.]MDD3036420.1 hypothetical protein [Bacteroides sp.]